MSGTGPAAAAGPPRVAPRSARASWIVRSFGTLRGRLLLLVCFATVPAILFIFYVSARERLSVLGRMETEARHVGTLASREHAVQLNGARSLLQRLATVVGRSDRAGAGAPLGPDGLAVLLSGFPQFANIGVAEPEGRVVASAAPIAASANLASNVAFERSLASRQVEVGTYVVGFVGRPVLHMAYAVRDGSDVPTAILFVAVELTWLDSLAKQANLPGDYSLLIADRDGHVLARSSAEAVAPDADRGAADSALSSVLDRPHGAVLQIGSPPQSRYFVATAMEGIPGVAVVVGLPYDRVEAEANQVFLRTLLGLGVVTVLVIVAAILAAEFSVLRVLRSLTHAVRRFGAGDLSARPPLPRSHGELRELAASFGSMADALAARQREALEAQERLRALSHRIQATRDEEAARIARELHDELGPVLTGLKMGLSRMCRVCTGRGLQTTGEEAAAEMSAQIDSAIDSVRRMSSELRPPVLDRLGLAAALDALAGDIEARTDLAVVATVRGVEEPLDDRVKNALFRVVQEALTNVVRHARATEATVDLERRGDAIALEVQDNGRGADAVAVEGPASLGILGMRERIRLLGGTFRIRGEAGKGTTIRVEVPCVPAPAVGGDGSSPGREQGP